MNVLSQLQIHLNPTLFSKMRKSKVKTPDTEVDSHIMEAFWYDSFSGSTSFSTVTISIFLAIPLQDRIGIFGILYFLGLLIWAICFCLDLILLSIPGLATIYMMPEICIRTVFRIICPSCSPWCYMAGMFLLIDYLNTRGVKNWVKLAAATAFTVIINI